MTARNKCASQRPRAKNMRVRSKRPDPPTLPRAPVARSSTARTRVLHRGEIKDGCEGGLTAAYARDLHGSCS